MRARIRWDLLTTDWSTSVPSDTTGRVDLRIPPPLHWRFDERMIHDLQGGVAVQATFIVVELKI